MLPTYSWQFDNPYDEASDGFPDIAPAAQGLDRPLGDGARIGLEELLRLAGPAMAAAGRSGAITDRRIEEEGIPKATRLLLVPGMRVWSPGLRGRLRTFIAGGGRVSLIASPLDRRALRDGDAMTVGRRHRSRAARGRHARRRRRGRDRAAGQASPGSARRVSTRPRIVITAALATGRPRIARPDDGMRANSRRA